MNRCSVMAVHAEHDMKGVLGQTIVVCPYVKIEGKQLSRLSRMQIRGKDSAAKQSMSPEALDIEG